MYSININKSKDKEVERLKVSGNSKKIVYTLIVVIIVICVALFLNIHGKSSSNNADSISQTNKKASFKFSELAYDNKERLWFSFTGFDNSPDTDAVNTKLSRKTMISDLYVTKNGYITKYTSYSGVSDDPFLTINDLKKYSDKEIIEKFKELDKKNFEHEIQSKIDTDNQLKDNNPQYNSDISALQSMKYSYPKPAKMTITATDDGTSSTINNEKINGIYKWTWGTYKDSEQQHNDDGTVKYPINYEPESYKKDSTVIGVAKNEEPLPKDNIVDGINFAGFGGNFLTRIGKDQSLKFDSYKDKHVTKSDSDN